MTQTNGPGSTVGLAAIFVGALLAECIPLLAACVALAWAGFRYDRAHGYTTGTKKKRPGGGNLTGRGTKTPYIPYQRKAALPNDRL